MVIERRRDAAKTRLRILAVAKTHFSARGYDRTTVRAIATDAGVAANLITRYFGGKAGLFRAAAEIDLRVSDALPGPREQLGDRIAAQVVERWESVEGGDPLLTMLRAAMNDATEAQRMAEFFHREATGPVAEYLGGSDGWERASAISVFIMGTVVQRYVLRAGPVAQAGPEQLTAWLSGVLQRLGDTGLQPLS